MPTLQLDFAPHAQILRTLMPRIRSIYLYAPDAELIWSSEGADYQDLRPTVEQLLEDARQPGQLERAGSRTLLDELPTYCFLLRDELGRVTAVLAILCRAPTREGEVPSFESVERTLASLLALARRDLAQARLAESGRFDVGDTQELQWLLDVTHIGVPGAAGPDLLQSLLDAYTERCECDAVLLHVPGRHLDRTSTRAPLPPRELEMLQAIVARHLYRVAQLQQRTLIVNKVRETAAGGLVPFRILCVPLVRRGAVIGAAIGFNRVTSRPFETREARMLERLGPRLLEIIDQQFDEGTGLLTRHAFEERAAELIAAKPQLPRAVVYANVDQLHVVNDLFGFAAGDEVLYAVADAWRREARPPGSLASRIAGDRFCVLLEDASVNRAQAWATRMRERIAALAAPERCVGVQVSASFGVAVLEPGARVEHAFAAAETACKAAKDRGRNRVETFSTTDQSLVQRHDELRLYRELVDAFEKQRFRLYAQPMVPLWDPSRPVRYEILVRLLDAQDRPVAPARFLPAATRYQLLGRLDRWVLEESLAELARRHEWLAGTSTSFALNVSVQSLSSPEYVDAVRDTLAATRVPPGSLAFELAESAAIGRLPEAEQFIARLAELGCRTTIDDFGTGVSSLAYLKALPVTALKIDGSFVRDLLTNPRSEAMVRAMLQIARQLELETIAENVESTDVATQLATLGVTYGQGWAFGQPRPLVEVLDEASSRRPPRLTESVAAAVGDDGSLH